MSHPEQTQWLKNPLHAKQDGLKPFHTVLLKSYYGMKRKLCLRHTSYQIGSDKSCDIVLDDPFISRRHALLKLNADSCYEIEDQSSKNGLVLNGTKIHRAKLPAQALLRIGRSTISWNITLDEAIDSALPEDLVVRSEGMRDVVKKIRVAAQSALPVLLLGETGTGKDGLARLLHLWGSRADANFIALNAATASGNLVDSELFGHKKGSYTGSEANRLGALLSAHKGILFLDEIGDLPLDTQAKLLRVLETGEVKAIGSDAQSISDFRLISATSRNLDSLAARGDFRMDLLYRISGFVIHVPPLRERRDDILPLAQYFTEKEGMFLEEECHGKLLSYEWPGNVRELRSVILRGIAMSKASNRSMIGADQIEFFFCSSNRLNNENEKIFTLQEMEEQVIKQTLERTGWSRIRTAQELGIARSTLFEKMKKYQIMSEIPAPTAHLAIRR